MDPMTIAQIAMAAKELLLGPTPNAPQVQTGGGKGIEMRASSDPDEIQKALAADASNKLAAGDGGALPLPTGGSQQAPSVINEAVAKADGQYPLTPPEAELFGTGSLLTPDFGKSGDISKEKKGGMFAGMSTAEKMEMAASLGSLLQGPGPPPAPSAPSGGVGINMSPAFLGVTLGQLRR
jgi:hypothetical protein